MMNDDNIIENGEEITAPSDEAAENYRNEAAEEEIENDELNVRYSITGEIDRDALARKDKPFYLDELGDSYAVYKNNNYTVRLDFVSETAVRVAYIPNGTEYIAPTVAVDPLNELQYGGRDRLSVKGFKIATARKISRGKYDYFSVGGRGFSIKINRKDFNMEFYTRRNLLFSDRKAQARCIGNGEDGYTYHYLTRERDEKIYGLGDKTGKINKNGSAYRIDMSDSMGFDAEKSDPLYKHVPFYICENSAGSYGVFYDTSEPAYMDFGKEINNYYGPYKYFKTTEKLLIYYVFVGSKLSVLKQYCRIIGKQAFPPRWSFGYCASTMAYTDSKNAQAKMHNFLTLAEENDIDVSAFYLSSGYTSIGDKRCVFTWNEQKFPSPEKFVNDFKKRQIYIIPNIKPIFLKEHPMYNDLARNEMFIKDNTGLPYVTQLWDGNGSFLDFTNVMAFNFWKQQVTEKLLDLGIKSTWNDNNEFRITDPNAYADGFGRRIEARKIRPVLTYHMALASYEAQRNAYRNLRPFLSCRSGNSGIRRIAQTWSGDNYTSFHDLRYCHYLGMTMSLSGFYFYGHDLGGFSGGKPSKELLLRWLQHGVFEPRFTIHSWNSDGTATMPWTYPDILEDVRDIMAQRKALLPYIYNAAYNCVRNDVPMTAPPFIYYDDPKIDPDGDSFMLGRSILVQCVLDEDKNTVEIYLPQKEIWYLGDEMYEGGQTVSIDVPMHKPVPYFVRGGSVLPIDTGKYGFSKTNMQLKFYVYPIKEGTFFSSFFRDDGLTYDYLDGNCVYLNFVVICTKDQVKVFWENRGNYDFFPSLVLAGGDKRKFTVAQIRRRTGKKKFNPKSAPYDADAYITDTVLPEDEIKQYMREKALRDALASAAKQMESMAANANLNRKVAKKPTAKPAGKITKQTPRKPNDDDDNKNKED